MPLSDWEPIVCELANGHIVRIVGDCWSCKRSISTFPPSPCISIRVYCTEGTLPSRFECVAEYVEEVDFPSHCADLLWRWLADFCSSREIYEFDGIAEFLDAVDEGLLDVVTPEPDAAEHFDHLPEISWPEFFDRVDDSIYNDQNDDARGT